MTTLSPAQFRGLLNNRDDIRIVTIIGQAEHGKSTLVDALAAGAGIRIHEPMEVRFMDTKAGCGQDRTVALRRPCVQQLFVALKPEDLTSPAGASGDGKSKSAAGADAGDKKSATAPAKAASTISGKGEAKATAVAAASGGAAASDTGSGEERTEPVVVPDGHAPYLVQLLYSAPDEEDSLPQLLRLVDGCVVVADAVETGEHIPAQTESMLRRAIAERVRPLLFVNKLDSLLLEHKLDGEAVYAHCARVAARVNAVAGTYRDELLGDLTMDPVGGSVVFGSALHGWAFSVGQFAAVYAAKFGLPRDRLASRLWGNHFFNPKTKKWTTSPDAGGTAAAASDSSSTAAASAAASDTSATAAAALIAAKPAAVLLERGFCAFVLRPIEALARALLENKTETYSAMLQKLAAQGSLSVPLDKLQSELKDLDSPQRRMRLALQAWLPAARCVLGACVSRLPSPIVAQKYRCETLYSGPQRDECARAIRACSPQGILMLNVGVLRPSTDRGRFWAIGRVFAGTVSVGQTVRIQGPEYKQGSRADLFVKKVQRCLAFPDHLPEILSSCPAGNLVGLVSIDQYILGSGTITDCAEAHNFVMAKSIAIELVRVPVEPANPLDLPKLIEGMRRLARLDPLTKCYTAETGEHFVACSTESHLERALRQLQSDFCAGGIKLKLGKGAVWETIRDRSSQVVICKSPNKHNRVYATAEPLDEAFCEAAFDGRIPTAVTELKDTGARAQLLADEFKWDLADAGRIWTFGAHPGARACVLVDQTKGVRDMHLHKDTLISSFLGATSEGVLCGEQLRGVRVNLVDLITHAMIGSRDGRVPSQLMPAMRRAVHGCQLLSHPALMEPVYRVDVTLPSAQLDTVYSTLHASNAVIEGSKLLSGTSGGLTAVKAYLPVRDSFGFDALLRRETSGRAFAQLSYSHMQYVEGFLSEEFADVDADSPVRRLVLQLRRQRGMSEELPKAADYWDKL